MTTSSSSLLSTEALTMRFGGVTAVENVDFSIGQGELRCLIGPNGAGKSTFFKLLCGMLTPTSGSVRFDGRFISGLQRHEIANAGIGIKTQVPNVFQNLTVRQNLTIAARRNREGAPCRDVVGDILDTFRLGRIAEAPAARLAHGQRQRVEIAMVVATGPRLILLDEPVAGLGDEETEHMASLILDLNKHAALIVVDHDIRFIRMIGSQATVFHRGAVLMEGDMETVLSDETVRDVYLGRMSGHA